MRRSEEKGRKSITRQQSHQPALLSPFFSENCHKKLWKNGAEIKMHRTGKQSWQQALAGRPSRIKATARTCWQKFDKAYMPPGPFPPRCSVSVSVPGPVAAAAAPIDLFKLCNEARSWQDSRAGQGRGTTALGRIRRRCNCFPANHSFFAATSAPFFALHLRCFHPKMTHKKQSKKPGRKECKTKEEEPSELRAQAQVDTFQLLEVMSARL